MFKVKTERRHWHRSGIFIVNFEQVDAEGLIQEKAEQSALCTLLELELSKVFIF